MKDKIKNHILKNNILYPKYNRNFGRRKYWKKVNPDWYDYLFTKYEEYNNQYPIHFANFLRYFIFDDKENVEYFYNVEYFLKYTKHLQINPGTKKYNLFYEKAKVYINFEPKNFTEIIYCYRNNLTDRPKCKECENSTKFTVYNDGYRKFCSQTCQIKHNNKLKEPKRSDLSNEEIRNIINTIPLDLRNLTTEKIADNFINIYEYSKHINNISEREMIYIFMNKLSEKDIICPHCLKDKKKFKSQGAGYTKTCCNNSCANIEAYGNTYYNENSFNINLFKGGSSYENGFLYIMKSEELECYKIGITQNPIYRLNGLKKSIPDIEIFDCFWLDNNLKQTETFLHRTFKLERKQINEKFDGYSEMFDLSADNIKFIRDYIYENKR